jgi:NADH-quinone oxidoreductase subunit N
MLVINSVIGLYYYIRIIALMFESSEKFKRIHLHPTTYFSSLATIFILAFLLIWFGIFPQEIIGLIRNLTSLG